MRYIKPAFYDEFACTADKCPDTCCAGWQIMIDEESLEKYSEVQGSFGRRLRNSIDWEEGAFYQYDRRCAFLNEDNLCDLYTALGSDALCETCRRYPRHVEEYEGLREWSLSLSCPVAAEIILSQQGFPEFIITEDEEADELEEEFEDFDLLLFTQLEDARKAVFDALKEYADSENMGAAPEGGACRHYAQENVQKSMTENTQENVKECVQENAQKHARTTMQRAMETALKLAEEMQECVEDGRYFEIEEVLRKYRISDGCVNSDAGQYHNKKELYHTMYGLERLRDEWTGVLEETFQVLYRDGEEKYLAIRDEFEAYQKQNPEQDDMWENTGLQLFVFFVYTYFCGAVYDDWIYSKMALAVRSVEFIRELLIARWKRKGCLEFEDYVELSYRYAREIEHSDQNLNELEECF